MLGMGMLVVFGALGLSQFSYPAILPAMQKALHLSNTQAGALAAANLAGYTCMTALGGALAFRFGLRRVILVGLLVAAAGVLITGTAGGFAVAAAGRVCNGVGAAAASVPAHTIPSQWFSQRRRGIATGVIVLGPPLGLIVSGPLVPRLVAAYGASGWRIAWYVLATVTLLVAIVGYFVIRDRPDEALAPADRLARAPEARRPGLRAVYGNASIWRMNAVFFTFGFAFMTYMTFFAKRLIADLHYSAVAAGNVFLIMGVVSLGCGILWGYISDRIGRKHAMALVLSTQAVSFVMFALWTSTSGVLLSAVLFGLTVWAMPAITAAACGDVVGTALAPTAYGFITMFGGVGQALGPFIAGRLADSFPTFTVSYLVAAGVALLGAIWALLMPLGHRPKGHVSFDVETHAHGR
jgi:MFS family permease